MSLYPLKYGQLDGAMQRNKASPLFMLNMQSGDVACCVRLYMKQPLRIVILCEITIHTLHTKCRWV